jgi:hypothetical protein
LRIFDFRFWIDSTDKSGGFYHQEIRLSATSSTQEYLNGFEMVSPQGEKLPEENADFGSRPNDVSELLSLPCRQQDG